MKKIVTLLCVIGFSLTTYAEMLLWQNGEFTIANLDSITFVAEPSVSVMPNTLNLGVGDSENLSAVLVPEQTSYDVPITWTSDNEEVATVSDGYVTALSYGTANIIVSAEGYAPDTCVVLVTNDAVLDNYQLLSCGLFGSPEMIPGTEQDITMSSGDTYKCQLGYITMYAWDNNITFVNGKGFGGAGYFFIAELPVFWITEGQYQGAYVGNSDGFYIAPNPEDTIAPYTALSGELVNLQSYGDFWKLVVDPATQTITDEDYALYTDAQVGTQIFYMDFAEEDQSWYLGNVANAHIYENEVAELQYEITIDWYDYVNENRLYGLLCNTDESGNVLNIVEPYDMRIIQKEYTNVSYEGKPAKRKAQAKAQYTVGGQIQNSTVAMKQVKQAVRAALKK